MDRMKRAGKGRAALVVVVAMVLGSVYAFAANMNVTSERLTTDIHTVGATPTEPEGCTVEFRAAASGATSGSTLTIAKPAGLASGDLLIAHIGVKSGKGASASGWTTLQVATNDSRYHIFYKIATTSDAGATSFSFSVSELAVGGLAAYSGVDTSNPIYTPVPSAIASGHPSSAVNAPALSSPAPTEGMRLAFFGQKRTSAFSTTSPSGMSGLRYNRGANDAAVTMADQALDTSGAADLKSKATSGNSEKVGQSAALRPCETPPVS